LVQNRVPARRRLAAVSRTVVRRFEDADERREFPGGVVDVLSIGPLTFGLETLHPGWRWSKDVRPIAGTDRCEFHHVGYQISGRCVAEDRDGTVTEMGPGDVFDIPPGHDVWVVGDEPCITLDFQGVAGWALRGAPSGTLTTVLFTDVVDSTALIGRIGNQAWSRLRGLCLEGIHAALAQHGGVLVDTAGDGALARFDSPAAAVRAASAISASAQRIGLQTRASVHTGEVERRDGGLTGMAVHIGARVLAQAEPGEVLVTSTVRDLTLDAGLDYDDRGSFELKGVPGARTLYAARL
jgi:class 3 adenylate cyclase